MQVTNNITLHFHLPTYRPRETRYRLKQSTLSFFSSSSSPPSIHTSSLVVIYSRPRTSSIASTVIQLITPAPIPALPCPVPALPRSSPSLDPSLFLSPTPAPIPTPISSPDPKGKEQQKTRNPPPSRKGSHQKKKNSPPRDSERKRERSMIGHEPAVQKKSKNHER
jgi:hypothetical protein